MNYFQRIWALEDKFRVIAIIGIALLVLGLSVVDSASDGADHNKHGSSMHMR